MLCWPRALLRSAEKFRAQTLAPGGCTSLSRVLRRLEPPQSNATALDATDASESAVDDADETQEEATLVCAVKSPRWRF